MKAVVLCVLGVLAVAVARPNEEYTDKYDNVDLDEVLSNKRLLEAYINCLLDQGKCAPDAKELKEHIIEALENHCGKCNENQKAGSKKVIHKLIKDEPKFWRDLSDKYDPEHKYTELYEKELKELQEKKE